MHLIKPSQISGEIMTLIEEADKKVILISPYFKVRKWYKLLNRLEALKQRDIEVEIYVRDNETDSIEEVLEIGFHPITIPNLHTKLYLNENYGIVSSMNLLLSSDTNSLDIALKTESSQEYNELFDYYSRYIKNSIPKHQSDRREYYDWKKELHNGLFEASEKKVHINEQKNKLQINTSNRYEAFFDIGKSNDLVISGILSGKEYDFALQNKESQTSEMEIELIKGSTGQYDTIWGRLKGLKSDHFSKVENEDAKVIVNAIIEFIVGVEQLKKLTK